MSILERINSSNDIKKLPEEELEPLCQELRDYMISSISRTGGHLASNLGAVELTVALHRVYDTSRDRVVFDVGHQSYVHKIITGRRDSFCTLRQHGGLSGFPKPYESGDDAFIAGHASNSVSVALGMARARTLSHADYDVAAIIGDGALSGGLAYEGLANAAASGEPLVVILNDNNMSINENVGGTAHLLESLRVRPGYISFKRWYRDVFTKLPGLYKFNHAIKEWLKKRLLPGNVFSGMGMYYLGPVDGHDIGKLETVIRWARELRKPVLVHVVTKKGKGYKYAEEHPEKFHGVGRFDIETGELHDSGDCFSARMGEYLSRLADGDVRIVGITAAMSSGTGMDVFSAAHPDRFFDVGIAEGHAVSMAGGMAKQGMVPVFAVYSSFLQRGYDMLIHDVALQNLHVVFCVDRAGLVGSDGETHHGVFDVSYLSSVPDMTVLCPASYAELETMLRAAIYDINGSVAIRYPRGGEGKYTACNTAPETLLREGRDVTLVCYGIMTNEVLDAAERLAAEGISAEVIKLSMIKPPDFDLVMRSLRKTGKLLISEDVCEAGCVGSRILEEAAFNETHVRAAKLLNLGEGIVPHGTVAELLHDFGLDADGIVSAAMEMMDKDMK
mgnify:FL=1